MTLLEEIQNKIAEESGQINWAYMKRNSGTHHLDIMWNRVAERYAQEKMKGLKEERDDLKQVLDDKVKTCADLTVMLSEETITAISVDSKESL